LISRKARTFSEAKGKYQEISLDFRSDELPLSHKMAGAMKTSDPAIPVCLSQLIRNNLP